MGDNPHSEAVNAGDWATVSLFILVLTALKPFHYIYDRCFKEA